jgi:predicted  nucleic acid-binding Zn-ribbon protein
MDRSIDGKLNALEILSKNLLERSAASLSVHNRIDVLLDQMAAAQTALDVKMAPLSQAILDIRRETQELKSRLDRFLASDG